jgi:aconitate hydratase
MSTSMNSFGAKTVLEAGGESYTMYRLASLTDQGIGHVSRLPCSLKVLLESLLRHEDGNTVTVDDIKALAGWDPANPSQDTEIAFRVARVLLQDFTGVPAVVDLAAMRDAMVRMGGDPQKINPLRPADLVIDHSVQVDHFGSKRAFQLNADLEFERNKERYALLRWGQDAFEDFRVVPPDTGIVHQVNLEYLAHTVFVDRKSTEAHPLVYPDSLVGTDSHTTMINGLGVVGWGVGGIEAEAALLGQPIAMLIPEVVGFELTGKLPEGTTATDLVLRVVQMLREKGVVGKFVEFTGAGMDALALPDRATIANMAPEYGATMGFFPVDAETLNYLRFSGRSESQVALVEAYCRANGLFRTHDSPPPLFSDTLQLDLSEIEPAIAGPHRPQDRVVLRESKNAFRKALVHILDRQGQLTIPEGAPTDSAGLLDALGSAARDELGRIVSVTDGESTYSIGHGFVAIAAITSCTNTSNPSVMVGAGLLARKANALGLRVKPWVKTSLAPGSKVVMRYLEASGLIADLEALNFHLVGFGCTTCIGNSGPLPAPIQDAVRSNNLALVSVLSGNRNFEGRIGPDVRANYLASPPLVVAYALVGRMDIDLTREPLGTDTEGNAVYLKDIWPTQQEIQDTLRSSYHSEMFEEAYGNVFEGDSVWQNLAVPGGDTYAWEESSTYIKEPPFFVDMPRQPSPTADIVGARVLAKLGDSVTTDHISPAGNIDPESPAGRYLKEHGVAPAQFNSYGSRRGNHEVMMRGTFANVRLRNQLAPGTEGGWTTYLPTGDVMSIYDAAMQYIETGTPLIVLAGIDYGMGSSRDWAAKGTLLLGVKAVIATSFERIHRSNLIGMGVLPLEFTNGQTHEALGLSGTETYTIQGLKGGLTAGQQYTVTVTPNDERATFEFTVQSRVDTPAEAVYYEHGGILQYVLRQLLN